MTNRDPYRPDFVNKVQELYNCLANYFSLVNDDKRLPADLNKKDIDLVCYYEINQIQKHMRKNSWGLHYNDFIKLNPKDENELINLLTQSHGNKI